ncbi:hypothetical protein QBC34DRAFT_417928 [Podospora aff. communis PSN243]|uniref:Uncharacterized protein n=1 Tax=Podospora aff. communis PSN243 TaxID=3040156 RepID=A0AAV9G474_9PEZI|nr:hypothetical protein QBC34DRAFT_417928 [Podospora aff. communis PSN243]
MGFQELFIFTALCLLQLSSARHYQFYRWGNPIERLPISDPRRQAPPLEGYHPEFGTCGSGTTCEDACGQNWITCKASTSLSLFCYNKVDLNQTCCGNGSGRACDSGYYCAWNMVGGKVWCCKNGQTPEECGVCVGLDCEPHSSTSTATVTTTTTTTTTQYTPTLTTTTTMTTTTSGSKTETKTTTTTTTVSGPHPTTVTVTIADFSTVLKTCTVTVTGPGTTITVPGPCPTPCKPTKPDWHPKPDPTPCDDPADAKDKDHKHPGPPRR